MQISFEAELNQRLQAEVYNVAGSLVKSPLNESNKGGAVNSTLDVSDLKAGVYMFHLPSGELSQTRKLYITR